MDIAEDGGRSAWIPSHLQVTVIQARNLALKSKNVNSEVYVSIQLDKERHSTHFLPRHTHPIWNDTSEFPLMSFQSNLEIQVRQKSKFTEDFIGQITIPVTNFVISKRVRKNWYKLAARPGKTSTKLRGDILIATCFLSQWDSKESTPTNSIDLDLLPEQPGKMLRRSKSEYKSKSKSSPKHDKSKQKSMFDRLRKNKSNLFEECEDFIPIRTPNTPPTPLSGERRKLFSSSSSEVLNGDLSSTVMSSPKSTDFKEMFSEATQMEKSGVLDLLRIDPATRLEQGRQNFGNTIDTGESIERNEGTEAVSPVLGSHAFRHKRPLRTQSLSLKTRPSFDRQNKPTDRLQKSLTSTTATTSSTSSATPPNFSPAVTYRATSMKRKNKRLNSSVEEKEQLSHKGSNASVDNDSMTSEYYSSTSLSENPTKSFSTISIEEEEERNGGTLVTGEKKQDTEDDSLLRNSSSMQFSDIDGNVHPLHQRVTTNNTELLELPKDAVRREKSVPTETQTLQREEVRLRKARKRYASDTVDKRHSADIESLLRLTINPKAKNDGLGNVLNAQQLQMRLKKQSTLERGPSQMSLSQPTGENMIVSRSATTTPSPSIQVDNKFLNMSQEVIPGLVSPTEPLVAAEKHGHYAYVENSNDHPQSSEPQISQETESLPAMKRAYHNDQNQQGDTLLKTPQMPNLDKAAFFESFESSSTMASMLCPPSSNSTSFESSYSSDYNCLNDSKRIDDDNLSSSQCTTPTSMTPVVTREGTPSPDLSSSEVSRKLLKTTTGNQPRRWSEEATGKRARHTFNKSNADFTKGNIPPLPPSLRYNSSLPAPGKYHSDTDMKELYSAALKVLAPSDIKESLPVNVKNVKYSPLPLSASNSGRTSPVIEENEEDTADESTEEAKTTMKPRKLPNTSVESKVKQTPQTLQARGPQLQQQSKGPRSLPSTTNSTTNYESNSLQRRRQGSGAGLKRALSQYQENRKQTATTRRALFRETSLDARPSTVSKDTFSKSVGNTPRHKPSEELNSAKLFHSTPKRPLNEDAQRSKRKSVERLKPPTTQQLDQMTSNNSNRDNKPSSSTTKSGDSIRQKSTKDSQSNSIIGSHQHTTMAATTPTSSDPGSHFDLPPPPDVSHTSIAEQVCGIVPPEQEQNAAGTCSIERRSHEEEIGEKMGGDSGQDDWKSSQSTLGTSSDECEELCEKDLEQLSKQALIDLVLEFNGKLIKSKKRLGDTQIYLDSLLLKVMEKNPELLGSQ